MLIHRKNTISNPLFVCLLLLLLLLLVLKVFRCTLYTLRVNAYTRNYYEFPNVSMKISCSRCFFVLFFFNNLYLELFLRLLNLVFWSYMLTLGDLFLCEPIFKSLSFYWKYILLEFKKFITTISSKNEQRENTGIIQLRSCPMWTQ